MGSITGVKDSTIYDDFRVVDSSDVAVTGLVAGDFTIRLYNPSGTEVSGSITVSITELGNGDYRASYTPNANGLWFLMIIHATHFPEGKGNNHQVFDADISTVHTNVVRALGLAQENFRIYDQTYDSGGNMTDAKVKIYPTATDADNDTNAIATYTIEATFSGVECTEYKVTKD